MPRHGNRMVVIEEDEDPPTGPSAAAASSAPQRAVRNTDLAVIEADLPEDLDERQHKRLCLELMRAQASVQVECRDTLQRVLEALNTAQTGAGPSAGHLRVPILTDLPEVTKAMLRRSAETYCQNIDFFPEGLQVDDILLPHSRQDTVEDMLRFDVNYADLARKVVVPFTKNFRGRVVADLKLAVKVHYGTCFNGDDPILQTTVLLVRGGLSGEEAHGRRTTFRSLDSHPYDPYASLKFKGVVRDGFRLLHIPDKGQHYPNGDYPEDAADPAWRTVPVQHATASMIALAELVTIELFRGKATPLDPNRAGTGEPLAQFFKNLLAAIPNRPESSGIKPRPPPRPAQVEPPPQLTAS